jgi:tetratricopeptide (TPR) repeat protein
MKLRCCFVPRQLLFLLAAGLSTMLAGTASGQETITFRSGQTQQVHILGVTTTGIKVQMNQGVMVQPFTNITAVTMEAPPEFTAAQTAYEAGDFQKALPLADSVVKNYRGLPTDWAREAMVMLGDLYVDVNKLPQAQAAYADLQRAYPSATGADIAVGMARIDISNKNYDAAKAKIEPILAQAQKQRNLPRAAAALIGRAYYISGQIKEAAGDFQGALEDYLKTVAVFPQDRVAASGAQDRADSIRKDHNIVAP